MREPITKELREHAADHVRVELLEIADRIDAEHKRRMEQSRYETRRAVLRYLRGVLVDYERGVKRVRKGDTARVVRCRDCRWAVPMGDCCLCGYRPVMAHLVKSDGYCSDGVRREDENDE